MLEITKRLDREEEEQEEEVVVTEKNNDGVGDDESDYESDAEMPKKWFWKN